MAWGNWIIFSQVKRKIFQFIKSANTPQVFVLIRIYRPRKMYFSFIYMMHTPDLLVFLICRTHRLYLHDAKKSPKSGKPNVSYINSRRGHFRVLYIKTIFFKQIQALIISCTSYLCKF